MPRGASRGALAARRATSTGRGPSVRSTGDAQSACVEPTTPAARTVTETRHDAKTLCEKAVRLFARAPTASDARATSGRRATQARCTAGGEDAERGDDSASRATAPASGRRSARPADERPDASDAARHSTHEPSEADDASARCSRRRATASTTDAVWWRAPGLPSRASRRESVGSAVARRRRAIEENGRAPSLPKPSRVERRSVGELDAGRSARAGRAEEKREARSEMLR